MYLNEGYQKIQIYEFPINSKRYFKNMTWLQNAEFYPLLLVGSKIKVCLFPGLSVYYVCYSILLYSFCWSQAYKCCLSISPVLLLKVCTIWPRLYCY